MKSKFLLSLSLLASISAFAQQSVLKYQVHIPQSSTTSTDSLVHLHSNGRNSTITTGGVQYFPGNGVYAEDTTWQYYITNGVTNLSSVGYKTYNSAGMLSEVVTQTYTPSGAPANVFKTLFSYNIDMLPDTVIGLENGINQSRVTYAYQGKKLVERRRQVWVSSTNDWHVPAIDSFIATGGTGSDSFYVTYGFSGTTQIEGDRHKYIRDANNRILIDTLFHFGDFSEATYFEYDAQGRLAMDSLREWNFPQATSQFTRKHTYRYDANSNLTSIHGYSYIANPMTYAVDSITYNIHNQITSRQTYDPSAGWILVPNSRSSFYYYFDPVNVPEIATQNTLQLYPVPATSHINLAMQFTKPQAFSVRIFDMHGRLVTNWQEPAQKDYNKQIVLTGMAPGQYTLHIWAGEESCSKQFMVVR